MAFRLFEGRGAIRAIDLDARLPAIDRAAQRSAANYLADDDLRQGAVVVDTLVQFVVARRVLEPGCGVEAGHDAVHPDIEGRGSVDTTDDPAHHDMFDCPAQCLGFELRVEVQHDPVDAAVVAHAAQKRQ